RIEDPHGVRAAGGAHDDAVPEDLRGDAGRPNAVRARRAPGPRDPGARRDRVHRRILTAVVPAAEEIISHSDLHVRAEWAGLAIDEVVHRHEVLRPAR